MIDRERPKSEAQIRADVIKERRRAEGILGVPQPREEPDEA